jgi:hypothetical protein
VLAPVSVDSIHVYAKRLESSASMDAQKLGHIIFDPGGSVNSTSLASFTEVEVSSFRARGQLILDEPMISGSYSDNDLDMSLAEDDQSDFNRLGLRSIIEERTQALRWIGGSRQEVANATAGFKDQAVLLDLMENGVR